MATTVRIKSVAVARLRSVALDCADPAVLASFWAELLGGDIAFTSDTFVAVKTDRVWLSAVQVPNYRAPSWPSGDSPKQMHLDLAVDDLDQAEAEALRLGANRAADQPAPDRWRVMLDPAGHPFCLSTQIPE
jgi:Glyoxalase-like domain